MTAVQNMNEVDESLLEMNGAIIGLFCPEASQAGLCA